MTDSQINYLKPFVGEKNNPHVVWWQDSSSKWNKIISIQKAPAPKEIDDVPEPSEVAFVNHRGYIALYNVAIEDIMITTGDLADWPTV